MVGPKPPSFASRLDQRDAIAKYLKYTRANRELLCEPIARQPRRTSLRLHQERPVQRQNGHFTTGIELGLSASDDNTL